ncbi:unannotated protein [freshwater metagenome]|uniref:Unannotated protein n=1 Tax=freshwater metagenome TaxID=449393 RepID=A0A6J7EMS3_9ZZZZ
MRVIVVMVLVRVAHASARCVGAASYAVVGSGDVVGDS